MKIKLIIIFCFIVITHPVFSETYTNVFAGHVIDGDYLVMDKDEKNDWVRGALDGILAMALHGRLPRGKDIGDCIQQYQITDIVQKLDMLLQEKSSLDQYPVAPIIYNILWEECKFEYK